MKNISKNILETYKNIYLGPFLNKQEKFQETTQNISQVKYDPILSIVGYIIFFFAIFLSFRCNNGFSVWGFLGAFFFSPIYIIYKLTSTPKMCNFIK